MKKTKSTATVVICSLCVILGIALAFAVNLTADDYEVNYSANNVQIGDLMEELADLNALIEGADTVEYVSTNLSYCADLGKKVAAYQTEYQRIDVEADEFMDNVYALDACFDESSKNARVPWFYVEPAVGISWTWTFQTTYGFAGDVVDVLWLCHEDVNGDLVAYATGKYYVEAGLFSGIEYHMTTIGSAYAYQATPGVDGSVDDDVSNGVDSNVSVTNPDDNATDSGESGDTIAPDETVDVEDPGDIGGGGAPAYDGV